MSRSDEIRVIPGRPEDIGPAWLTDVLRRAGVLQAASVSAVHVERTGDGMTGDLARVGLLLDRPEPPAPASVIVKFRARAGPTLDLAGRLRIYEREAGFYRDVSARAGVPVPRCYAVEGPTENAVLVLEDMAPAVAGDLAAGSSIGQAATIVDWLASLHGTWWCHKDLDALAWLPLPNDQAVLDLSDNENGQDWRTFRSRIGSNLPASVRAVGERLVDQRYVLDAISSPPLTLVHGDVRNNNVMFANDSAAAPVALIDWQTAKKGRAAIDLASFFLSSLSPADRRTAERELLPAYLLELRRFGVDEYSFDECWRDYRLAVVDQFGQIVVLSTMLDVGERLDNAVALATGARLFAAIEELDLTSVLRGPGLYHRLRSLF